MRSNLFLCLLFAAGFSCASLAMAQPHVLPYAGYNLSAGYDNGASFLARETDQLDIQGGLTLGVGVDFDIPWDRLPFALGFRPSIETTFVPGETVTFSGGESLEFSQQFWQASVTLVGEIPVGRAPVVPFLGFGLAYARYTADFEASDGAVIETSDGNTVTTVEASAWELAPNLIAGLRFGRGRVAPLLQVRYRFANPEPEFSDARPGNDIDNGFSVVAGARIAL